MKKFRISINIDDVEVEAESTEEAVDKFINSFDLWGSVDCIDCEEIED